MSTPWPTAALGEVLTQHKEYIESPELREYPKLSVKLYGRGVNLDRPANGAELRMKRHQIAKAGQVILSEIWGKKGAIGIVPPEGEGALCTSHFFLFDIRNERVDPKWLQAIFVANFLEAQLGSEAKGTTGYAAVRPQHLLAAKIPLPPLAEQRRIVEQIDRLASRISEARALRQQGQGETGRLIPSRIKFLFEAGQHAGWRETTLGDCLIDASYGTSEKAGDDKSETPVLRMGNIQDGRLDLRDLKYLEVSQSDRARLLLKPGDILVNRTNSAELVGKCAVFEVEGEFSFASYLIRLRLDTGIAEPKLVAAYVNSPTGRAYLFSKRKQMTGQANINLRTIRGLPIALPTIPEQRRILGELDALQAQVDALKRLQSEAAAELDALLPSILDKAFRGELC